MDAATKIARQRLSVLELAEIPGNVSEACRRRGMTRTQFYEYERRFQTHGLEGFKDPSPIPRSHSQTTPPVVMEKIKKQALAHRASDTSRGQTVQVASGAPSRLWVTDPDPNRRRCGKRYEAQRA